MSCAVTWRLANDALCCSRQLACGARGGPFAESLLHLCQERLELWRKRNAVRGPAVSLDPVFSESKCRLGYSVFHDVAPNIDQHEEVGGPQVSDSLPLADAPI